MDSRVHRLALQTWNRRQSKRHQYTPPVSAEEDGDELPISTSPQRHGPHEYQHQHSAARGQYQLQDYRGHPLHPSSSSRHPQQHRSARALKWDKRTHQAPMNTFSHKVTSLPEPAVVQAQEERIRQEGRRYTSFKEFNKMKMAHQTTLYRAAYSLDYDDDDDENERYYS